MEIKLQKWGNSDGIRIPSAFLKSLNLKTDDIVDIYVEDNKIIISKHEKNHMTLRERIVEYNKLPKDEKGKVEEYNWGEDMGLEKWD